MKKPFKLANSYWSPSLDCNCRGLEFYALLLDFVLKVLLFPVVV